MYGYKIISIVKYTRSFAPFENIDSALISNFTLMKIDIRVGNKKKKKANVISCVCHVTPHNWHKLGGRKIFQRSNTRVDLDKRRIFPI